MGKRDKRRGRSQDEIIRCQGSQGGTASVNDTSPGVSQNDTPAVAVADSDPAARIRTCRAQYLRYLRLGLTPAQARQAIRTGDSLAAVIAQQIHLGHLTLIRGLEAVA